MNDEVWTHGYNSCLHIAISALNHLSSHPRPAGGQEAYNAEHLLQIADEIKRTIAHNVKVAGSAPAQQQPTLDRLRRCITMAMGCLDAESENPDERLAWLRLSDGMEGREPRTGLDGGGK